MKTILFHSNQLGLRGTEVAVYDYAHFAEQLLGHRSCIATPRAGDHHPDTVAKFERRFEVFYYDDLQQLQAYADQRRIDVFYAIKSGQADDLLLHGVRNCVHAVFGYDEPHGDVYAYVSAWLARTASQGRRPYVPHIISLPEAEGDLREELGIPAEATVFGRLGGRDSFDIDFARRTVCRVAARNPRLYFVFMNTDDFTAREPTPRPGAFGRLARFFARRRGRPPNIIFLEGSADGRRKARFIKTCDAMLHARARGESFGIACGEFSILNRPVITCDAPWVVERNHLEVLGDKGLYYADARGLETLLVRFDRHARRDWDAYSRDYNPAAVMRLFAKTFLDET